MRVSITVKPNTGKECVEELSDGSLFVSVKARAAEGKANQAVERILARHFDVAPSCVSIVSGASSRNKRVEVLL